MIYRELGFPAVYSNDRHLLAAAPHLAVAGMDVIERSKSPDQA